MITKLYKAFKYRIYPNKQQERLIQKTFGCCRFVYNQTLAYRKGIYETEGKSMGKFDCDSYCTRVLKKEYEWLKEVDKFSLTNSVFNMDSAYQKFFKEHAGYPKFKSKKDARKSYTTTFCNNNVEVYFERSRIKLPKLKWVKAKVSQSFTGQIKFATISQNPSGKYFVSITVDCEIEPLEPVDNKVGIDLGIKDLVITSNRERFQNPKALQKYQDKLTREQRKLSKKKLGSKNRIKQRIKVAKIYEKITNIRKDNLHKISRKLINENQVIVSENLQVSNMVKNHNLAKNISDCGWYELTKQLGYKAEWYGRTYLKVGTFYPSSQTCSCCGYVNPETKNLSIREWEYPECHTVHDRDVNAAKKYPE